MAYEPSLGVYLPDYLGAVTKGLGAAQDLRTGSLKQQHLQQMMQERERRAGQEAQLRKLSPGIMRGDPGVLQQAYAVDPTARGFSGALEYKREQEAAKEVQETKNREYLASQNYPLINNIRKFCSKIIIMQEGCHWDWMEDPVNTMVWFYI